MRAASLAAAAVTLAAAAFAAATAPEMLPVEEGWPRVGRLN